jgi:hypothetical protein
MISARRGRDDRDRGSACAKAVAADTSHDAGTSVTARIPTASDCSVSGRRPSARPGDGRTPQPKLSTPRRNVRADSVPGLRHNLHRQRHLRQRVVTPQK